TSSRSCSNARLSQGIDELLVGPPTWVKVEEVATKSEPPPAAVLSCREQGAHLDRVDRPGADRWVLEGCLRRSVRPGEPADNEAEGLRQYGRTRERPRCSGRHEAAVPQQA